MVVFFPVFYIDALSTGKFLWALALCSVMFFLPQAQRKNVW